MAQTFLWDTTLCGVFSKVSDYSPARQPPRSGVPVLKNPSGRKASPGSGEETYRAGPNFLSEKKRGKNIEGGQIKTETLAKEVGRTTDLGKGTAVVWEIYC